MLSNILKVGSILASTTIAGPVFAACYPATDQNPLELELIVQGTGGTFWEKFEKFILKPFEAECGVSVTLTVTPNRGLSELRSLVRRGGAPWDFITVNTDWDMEIGKREGLFEKLPSGFWNPIADTLAPGSYTDYGYWSNIYSNVIIYKKNTFITTPNSWEDFWDTKKFPGPRSLQDSPTNIVAALLAAGVDAKDIYPITDAKLKRAFDKLDELRPNIRTFWTTGDAPVQGVEKGDFVMASAYNGRAFNGIGSGYNIGIVWNQNLLNLVWGAIPAKAAHPRAAQALMVFINRPEIQRIMAVETGYTSAIKSPESLVDKNVASSLASSAEHIEQSAALDGRWWTENITRVQGLWREWVTTGKVTF